jgi:hypothetical protein
MKKLALMLLLPMAVNVFAGEVAITNNGNPQKPVQCSGFSLHKAYTFLHITFNPDGSCVGTGIEKPAA